MAVEAELERLVATITADSSGFVKAMRTAQAETQKAARVVEGSAKGMDARTKEFGVSFGKTVDDLGTKMSNMAGQMRAMAAIESPFGFLKSGVGLAADAELAETQFGTMLKSVQRGKDMVADLTKFAAETPLNMAGLQQTTKTLLQFGVAGEDIIPTIRMLGDTVGGEQDKLSRMAIAFGQARAAGRLMGEEVAQMREAGFNPLQEISRTTGKSMVQLMDDMSKGKITIDMLEGAFKSATSAGGMFEGGMAKASKTFSGLASTMQDDIDAAKRSLGQMVIEEFNLKERIREVSQVAQSLTGTLKGLDSETRGIISTTATAVLGFGAAVVTWKVGSIAVGMLVGNFRHMIGTIGWVTKGVYAYATSMTLAATKQAAFNAVLAATPWVAGAAAAAAMVAGMGAIIDRVSGLGEELKEANKELARSKVLGDRLAELSTRRLGREEAEIMAIENPAKKMEALAAALERGDRETAGFRASIAAASRELDGMSGIADRIVRSDLVPFVGRGEVMDFERVTGTLAELEGRYGEHQKFVERLRAEQAKLEAARGKPDPAMLKAVEDYTNKLELELLTMGKAAGEAEILRLQRMKASDADLAAARSLSAMVEARKKELDLSGDIARMVEGLKYEAATLGMTSEEKKLYELVTRGATDAMLAEARALMGSNAQFAEHAKLVDKGEAMLRQWMSPQQKLAESMVEVEELFAAGVFSQEQYEFALSKVQEEFGGVAEQAQAAQNAVAAFDAALSGGAEAQRRLDAYTEMLNAPARSPQASDPVPVPLAGPVAPAAGGNADIVKAIQGLAIIMAAVRDKPGLVVAPAGIP